MITGVSATSRIRIIPGRANAIAPTAKERPRSRQTASELPTNFRLRGTDFTGSSLSAPREMSELVPVSYSYCITDLSKPVDLKVN